MHHPYSFYHNQAVRLHTQWCENLKGLKTVTEPEAKQLWLDDLLYLARQAAQLTATGQLNAHDTELLRHITDRTIAEHVAILKAAYVVPLF
jgi:hypothetical protein